MAETTVTPTNPYEFIQLAPIAPRVRVTLQSGNPVMTSNSIAATQVIITPYQGNIFPAYRPTVGLWRAVPFSEFALQLTLGTSSQQVTTASNYDILGDLDLVSGQTKFYLSPAWSTATNLGSGPGSAERTTVAGIALNRWNVTGGPDAMRGTVLGSIRTGTSAAVDWQLGGAQSSAILNIGNMYNRKPIGGHVNETTASWTWNSTSYRAVNGNSTGMRVTAMLPGGDDACRLIYTTRGGATVGTGAALVGWGLDTAAIDAGTPSGTQGFGDFAVNRVGMCQAIYDENPGIGSHFWVPHEAISLPGGSTATFLGASASAPFFVPGIAYLLWL